MRALSATEQLGNNVASRLPRCMQQSISHGPRRNIPSYHTAHGVQLTNQFRELHTHLLYASAESPSASTRIKRVADSQYDVPTSIDDKLCSLVLVKQQLVLVPRVLHQRSSSAHPPPAAISMYVPGASTNEPQKKPPAISFWTQIPLLYTYLLEFQRALPDRS